MSRNVNDAIISRAKQLKIDILYSKKGHYNAASVWNTVHYALGITAAVLAGFIGVKNSAIPTDMLVVIAMTIAALGATTTFLKPQEKAAQHKLSGDDFDNLLQNISTFIEVELLQGDDEQHTARLQELSQLKTDLNKSSLPIPRVAYTRARTGIGEGEAAYTEDI